MNVLFVGHAGCYNRGCETLLSMTMDSMLACEPSCKFAVLTMCYDYDRECVPTWDVDCRVWDVYPPKDLVWMARRVLRKLFGDRVRPYYLTRNRRYFRWADVVVGIGGDNLSSEYGLSPFHMNLLDYPLQLGCPAVLSAASISVYRDPAKGRLLAELLKRLTLVTVRETKTLEYLKSLGVRDNLHLVGDPAFLLRPLRTARNSYPLLETERMKVGIGPSALVSRYSEHAEEDYVRTLAQFGRYLADRHNAIIVLVPHVIYDKPDLNDLRVARRLAEALGEGVDVLIPGEDLSAAEMKDVIARCNYFVGARTHGTIAAFSSMVPAISVGYSIKAEGLNLDLLDHERYVLPIADLCLDVLRERFETLVADTDEVVSRLQKSVPEMQDRARLNGRLIVEAARTQTG